jgi:hypothetical protein
MKAESSPTRSQLLEGRLDLLRRAAAGELTDLPCPECGQCKVSVWFTHPAEHEYRTSFVCDHCGFELRAQNSERPRHYSAERDRTGQRVSK